MTATTPEVVLMKMQDLRVCRFCNKGARQFFLSHNLNWKSFVQQGVDVRVLEQTGDPMALRAVAVARARVAAAKAGASDGK